MFSPVTREESDSVRALFPTPEAFNFVSPSIDLPLLSGRWFQWLPAEICLVERPLGIWTHVRHYCWMKKIVTWWKWWRMVAVNIMIITHSLAHAVEPSEKPPFQKCFFSELSPILTESSTVTAINLTKWRLRCDWFVFIDFDSNCTNKSNKK